MMISIAIPIDDPSRRDTDSICQNAVGTMSMTMRVRRWKEWTTGKMLLLLFDRQWRRSWKSDGVDADSLSPDVETLEMVVERDQIREVREL